MKVRDEGRKEAERLLYIGLVVMAAMFVTCMCSSCRSQQTVYVPMEVTRLDSMVVHDTTFAVRLVPHHDSVAVRDTASFLCNPYAYSYAGYSDGLLRHSLGIWPQATVTLHVPYFIDRYVRVEVPKPYPVEKEMGRWQRVKLDYGGYAIGAIVVVLLIVFGKMVYKLKKGG